MSVKEEIETLTQDVEREIERIWLEEPEEIKKLRLGFIDSGAGSYGQYFTTFVFVDGEIRALGYLCYTGILNAINDPDFDLKQIQKMARIFIPVCSHFLGYCGLEKVWEFSQRFLDLTERAEKKDDLNKVVRTLVLYMNRMHGWIHFYLPWATGAHCRLKTKEETMDLKSLTATWKEE